MATKYFLLEKSENDKEIQSVGNSKEKKILIKIMYGEHLKSSGSFTFQIIQLKL